MSVRNILCSVCNNLMRRRMVDDKFVKYCVICETDLPCTRDEYIIKTTMYSNEQTDLVVYDSVRDDPCLPFMDAMCTVCGEIRRVKYIRNNESLKISHIICTTCGSVLKLTV